MRLQKQFRDVEIHGATDINTFTVAMGGKIFDILSKKMYERPAEAVLRELCANAYDSNKDAGRGDVPIHVTLPSAIAPVLKVRDDGLGMSHDFVMKTYTSYGMSTKDDYNDAIGGFGLGCKSPFAVTDTFTLISRYDGRKRTYSAIIGRDGVPQMSCLGDIETSEDNGVEVIVPCSKDMIREFRTAAKQVFEFYDPMPVFHGFELSSYDLEKETATVETDTYICNNTGSNYYGSYVSEEARGFGTVRILMGVVAYPVDMDNISIDSNLDRFRSYLNFVLKMPIGSVELAPSRERLNYDKATKEAIKTALEDAVTDSIERLLGPLTKIDDRIAANIEYAKIRNTLPFLPKSFTYKGKEYTVSAYVNLYNEDMRKGANLKVFDVSSLYSGRIATANDDDLYSQILYRKDVVFVIDDVYRCYARAQRIANAVDNIGGSIVVYINNRFLTKHNYDASLRVMEDAMRSIFEQYGVPDIEKFILMSQTPEIPREFQTRGWSIGGLRKISTSYLRDVPFHICNNETVCRASDELYDEELPEDALYVVMSRGKPEIQNSRLYRIAGDIGKPVMLVAKTAVKKIPDTWSPMSDAIDEHIGKVRVGQYLKHRACAFCDQYADDNIHNLMRVVDHSFYNSRKLRRIIKYLEKMPDHPLSQLLQMRVFGSKFEKDENKEAAIQHMHQDRAIRAQRRINRKAEKLINEFKQPKHVFLRDYIINRSDNSLSNATSDVVIDFIFETVYGMKPI